MYAVSVLTWAVFAETGGGNRGADPGKERKGKFNDEVITQGENNTY